MNLPQVETCGKAHTFNVNLELKISSWTKMQFLWLHRFPKKLVSFCLSIFVSLLFLVKHSEFLCVYAYVITYSLVNSSALFKCDCSSAKCYIGFTVYFKELQKIS